jgi:Glycosyl transferase family 2
MEFAFILSRRQNQFFVEIVDAIRDELDQVGVPSSVHRAGFPTERDDLVYVLTPPHEWFNLDRRYYQPTTRQLARTIFICAEQPGTAFFVDDAALGELAGAVFDINAGAIGAFEQLGLKGVRHLPLGWTRTWDHALLDDEGLPRPDAHRDIDILHLGIFSEHRAFALAAGARWLSRWNCRLILGDPDRPNSEPAANFAVSEEKWNLLSRSRVLLNLHVANRPYFETLRIVQAIACGCAIVTEHSLGTAPLAPGVHMLSGRPEALGLIAGQLLRDEEWRTVIARAAYAQLRGEMSFAASVAGLVEAADEIVSRRNNGRSVAQRPLPSLVVEPFEEPAAGSVTQFPRVTNDPDAAAIRAAIKDLRIEMMELRRAFDRLGDGEQEPRASVELDSASRAYAAVRPRISVVTPLYNYADHVEGALTSIVRGRYEDFELIVVDDGSTDASLQAARRFLADHEGVPMLLVRHPVNQGLGAARNTAVDFARGEFCFMLDADNELFHHALARLTDALEEDSVAAAAYGMLERFAADRPVGLQSALPWCPERLRIGNYIDAMALWRSSELRKLGGYTTDRRLYGWEDYDLWCRLAESNGHATFVPEILARYRVTRHSMLSVTNISARAAISLIVEQYPTLMAGVEPPM